MEEHINKVELIGTYGSDETHALSAWTSTSRDLTDEKRGRMGKLLTMLATNGHHSIFEKSALHFLVTSELASHIHLLKHRIGVSCITGDTKIHLPRQGGGIRFRTIEQIYREHTNGIESSSKKGKKYNRKYGRKIPVRSKNVASDLIETSYISNVFYNGKKDVFQFTTESGKVIKSTSDHLFMSPDREWVEIGEFLGLEIKCGVAAFSNKNCYVATNGVILNDPKRPWTFRSFFEPYEGQLTRIEVANQTELTYELVKKWGYIHDINFADDLNKDFKKGQVPWNKGLYGYEAPRESKGINPNINPNLSSKVWRATVGNWTRQQLPSLLVKYDYVCQAQMGICSRDFVCHHIIPVSISKELATDFDNLALVCSDCHKLIHKNKQSEIDFANRIKNEDVKTIFTNGKKPRVGRKLSISFEKIVGVKYIGVEDVYDLEIDNTHNYVANGFVIHNCNAESARYKELKDDKFYVPSDWNEAEQNHYIAFMENSLKEYHDCLARLKAQGVPLKRAKESARLYLPYGNQITADVQFNFRSFLNFQRLRNASDAQKEIRDIAQQMLIQVYETGNFPLSLEAFGWTKEKIYLVNP